MERRLAAIMATDVVGYSRLIRADEEGTLAALKALRADLIDPKIAEHHGRIVKLMGDGMLVEFASVVDAVHAAVETQQAVSDHNAGVPANKRIELRIGINLGDVVIDGDDIQGDGVNVAARLEGMAEPGGICVSGMVYEGVRDRIDVPFEDLGEQEVKNIERPVRVWRWLVEGSVTVVPKQVDAPLPLPDKPSIAVLPFTNMSGDPEQEYFSDGISEDILTLLSRNRWFRLVARNSSFAFKQSQADIREIGRELAARYVVDGSVRKSGNRIRVSTQLIDAEDGQQLWAEQYDRELDDIFDIQDEIARQIAATVEPELSIAEGRKARAKPAGSLTAWDIYQKGVYSLYKFDEVELDEAKNLLTSAIEIDPEFAAAHARLAYVYVQNYWYGTHADREGNLNNAIRSARNAIDLDERDALGHLALGRAYAIQKRCDIALAELAEAINLNPGLAQAHFAMGQALLFQGRSEEALGPLSLSIQLSPHDPHVWAFLHVYALALFSLDRMQEAENAAKSSVRHANATHWAFATLTSILGAQNKVEDTVIAKRELLAMKPGYSCRFANDELGVPVDENFKKQYVNGIRKAGLPE
jgi:TolB-like protein/class 3 adenylate cyclase/Flp pilus assembly protein TadD